MQQSYFGHLQQTKQICFAGCSNAVLKISEVLSPSLTECLQRAGATAVALPFALRSQREHRWAGTSARVLSETSKGRFHEENGLVFFYSSAEGSWNCLRFTPWTPNYRATILRNGSCQRKTVWFLWFGSLCQTIRTLEYRSDLHGRDLGGNAHQLRSRLFCEVDE